MSIQANTNPYFKAGERGEELGRVDGEHFTVLALSRIDAVATHDQRRTPFWRVAMLDAVAESWIYADMWPDQIDQIEARILGMCRGLAPTRDGETVEGITRLIEHPRPLEFFFGKRLADVKNLCAIARAAVADVRRNTS